MLSQQIKCSIFIIIEILVFVNQIAAVEQLNQTEQYLGGELDNPCFGRRDGFARDLASCERYFSCENGNAYAGQCEAGYVFDAESELCVANDQAPNVCFKCNPTKYYQLFSVPKACSQYILCFNGKPKLHACSNGLVFDGRNGIHQCNRKPGNVECYREDAVDLELSVCPPVNDTPIFFVDPFERSVLVLL